MLMTCKTSAKHQFRSRTSSVNNLRNRIASTSPSIKAIFFYDFTLCIYNLEYTT